MVYVEAVNIKDAVVYQRLKCCSKHDVEKTSLRAVSCIVYFKIV